MPTLPGTALTLIHTGQAPTRAALTSQLGVTRATTGAITSELRELGLILVDARPAEVKRVPPRPTGPHVPGHDVSGPHAAGHDVAGQDVPGRGGGAPQGRPSHRLLPDPAGPVALAAHVHPDGYEVALVGLGGTIVARASHDIPVPADPQRALAPVAAVAAGLLRESGRRCVGAAIAVPTAVTKPAGTAVGALYVGWPTGTPVRGIFAGLLASHGVTGPGSEAVGCEAVNDVNAIALAEHRHGAGRGASHLLVVVAEHRGVGGALVLRGALYTGSTGLAMEAGHVSVDPDGRECVCGNRGCLNVETDAERFLALAAGSPSPDVLRPGILSSGSLSRSSLSRDSLSPGEPVLNRAIAILRAGYPEDARVRAAADAIVTRLGQGLAGLINVVNPDRVLLGGLHRYLLEAAPDQLRETVAARTPWGRGAGVPIEPCALDHAGLIGAAEVAWQPVLDNPALLR